MSRASAALLAALLLTAAGAAKPLVIDDPVYVAYARQIALHPTDPYGFDFYWYDAPEPAMGIGTVPALLPYWLAAAMTLFGDHPVAWKLSLLPFVLALTGSLAFLLGRFAAPVATPVLFAIALGPTLLPNLNLMQDMPSVALCLLGYALFVRACESRSVRLALAAGIALGLAMQTKYSAVWCPTLVLALAAIFKRPREGAVALATAAALFVGWEGILFARYGRSHFLAGLERLASVDLMPAVTNAAADAPWIVAPYWTLTLISLAGGTLILPGMLAAVGLGATRRVVAAAALVTAAGFAAVSALPHAHWFESTGFFDRLVALHPETLVFVPLGLCVAALLIAVGVRSLLRPDPGDRRLDHALVAWLAIEIAGYFATSPYPAARRLLGVSIAATLLGARAAAIRLTSPDARAGVRIAVATVVALGLLYYGSDLADARTRRSLVERAEQRLSELGADRSRETVWFAGHWEFQFYAERAGMQQMVAGESHLRAGDWVVIPFGTPRAPLALSAGAFRREDRIPVSSPSPWSTIAAYYDGPVSLRRQPAWIDTVLVMRVLRDDVPWLERPKP